jgi:hypothetical protein
LRIGRVRGYGGEIRLAGAGTSDHADHLAGRNLQRYRLECSGVAEALAEVPDFQHDEFSCPEFVEESRQAM